MTDSSSSSGWSDPTAQPQPSSGESWSATPASPPPSYPPGPTYQAGSYPPPSAPPAYDAPDPYAYPTTTPAYQVQPAYPGAAGYGQQPTYVVARPTNGMAIASLVCSLAGFLTGITFPVGAILGHIAKKQIAETGEQGDGMALAGIIVGWIGTGIYVLCCGGYLVFVIGLFGAAAAAG